MTESKVKPETDIETETGKASNKKCGSGKTPLRFVHSLFHTRSIAVYGSSVFCAGIIHKVCIYCI
jgi:hypothetical protein